MTARYAYNRRDTKREIARRVVAAWGNDLQPVAKDHPEVKRLMRLPKERLREAERAVMPIRRRLTKEMYDNYHARMTMQAGE